MSNSLLGENCSTFLTVAVVGCIGGSFRRFAAELGQLEKVGIHPLLGKTKVVLQVSKLKRGEKVFGFYLDKLFI